MRNKTLRELHEGVSPDHYDKGIQNNLSARFWHMRRFAEIKKVLEPVSGKVLDVGCHGGLFTSKILDWTGAEQIYGIDISGSAIERAEKRIKIGHFIVGDAHKLPYPANYFEAVFCLEMIEHVDDPEKVLAEIRRVMKKDGYGIIMVPTENILFKIIWFIWNLRYPVWKHVHVQSFTGKSLENLLSKIGFEIIAVGTFNLGMLKIIKYRKRK